MFVSLYNQFHLPFFNRYNFHGFICIYVLQVVRIALSYGFPLVFSSQNSYTVNTGHCHVRLRKKGALTMSDSIILKVSELRSCIQTLRRDGIEYVELSILEPDEYDGDIIPATLEISGCKFNNPDFWLDYEGLEAVENSKELEEKSFLCPHASGNLF